MEVIASLTSPGQCSVYELSDYLTGITTLGLTPVTPPAIEAVANQVRRNNIRPPGDFTAALSLSYRPALRRQLSGPGSSRGPSGFTRLRGQQAPRAVARRSCSAAAEHRRPDLPGTASGFSPRPPSPNESQPQRSQPAAKRHPQGPRQHHAPAPRQGQSPTPAPGTGPRRDQDQTLSRRPGSAVHQGDGPASPEAPARMASTGGQAEEARHHQAGLHGIQPASRSRCWYRGRRPS